MAQETRCESRGKGYRKLIAWKKADELAFRIYSAAKTFPKDEMYGMTSQLRRAALSVAVNLAEGSGRQSKKEFKQFVNISSGSLAEVEYLLEFCFRLQYLSKDEYEVLEKLRAEAGALIWGLYRSL